MNLRPHSPASELTLPPVQSAAEWFELARRCWAAGDEAHAMYAHWRAQEMEAKAEEKVRRAECGVRN